MGRGVEEVLALGSVDELGRGVVRDCNAGGTDRKKGQREGSVGSVRSLAT